MPTAKVPYHLGICACVAGDTLSTPRWWGVCSWGLGVSPAHALARANQSGRVASIKLQLGPAARVANPHQQQQQTQKRRPSLTISVSSISKRNTTTTPTSSSSKPISHVTTETADTVFLRPRCFFSRALRPPTATRRRKVDRDFNSVRRREREPASIIIFESTTHTREVITRASIPALGTSRYIHPSLPLATYNTPSFLPFQHTSDNGRQLQHHQALDIVVDDIKTLVRQDHKQQQT